MKQTLRSAALVFSAALTVAGCGSPVTEETAPTGEAEPVATVEPAADGELAEIAEGYVRLVLAVGEHDADYVDAYYGPPEWRQEEAAQGRSLDQIQAVAEALLSRLEPAAGSAGGREDEMSHLRRRYLARQLEALRARVALLQGAEWSFDQESQALYDAVAPHHDEAHFQEILDRIDRLLAADGFTDGPLIERYQAFRQDFVIPPDELDRVFDAAIAACRERTAERLELPEGESFVVEYVTDKPWSGYNWYQGNYHSLIQVNTDLPIYIDRAVDLACHEGYPGHHLYNALLEKNLVRDRGWVELSVYPLFSPQSLIAEGSANYGIEMAFPGDERVGFEKEVLFPLAGLDPERADAYYRVQEAVEELSYAGNEAARRYLDGEIGVDQAVDWLTRYAAMEPERARQRVSFFDKYRSYVINYNLGQDLVRRYVEAEASTGEDGVDLDERWRVFGRLLSSPRLPSDLVAATESP
jgi:hypothetical protein